MKRYCLLPIALVVACSGGSTESPAQEPARAETAALISNASVPQDLKRSIQAAGGYLKRTTKPSGRFLYERALRGGRVRRPRNYNVLRHAGTIYSLAHYCTFDPADGAARATLLRAARYLKRRHLKPIPGLDPSWRGIASLAPEESDSDRIEWKLGGAGLGLVALCRARAIDPQLVSLDELRGLAKFIGFFQRKDGRYRAKYDSRDRWKHDFFSLYYPGEATLGLLLLYAQDPDPTWLQTAAQGVAALVRRRKDLPVRRVPADHWLLIAIGELVPRYGELKSPPVSEADVLAQATAIANKMMLGQEAVTAKEIAGSFLRDGRSTPTATRLEGLIALEAILTRPAQAKLRARIRAAIERGIAFLRRCQVPGGESAGGFAGSYRGLPGRPRFRARDAVIRVDFVQHALSALVGWAKLTAREGS